MHPTVGELIIYAIIIGAHAIALIVDPGRFAPPDRSHKKEPDDE